MPIVKRFIIGYHKEYKRYDVLSDMIEVNDENGIEKLFILYETFMASEKSSYSNYQICETIYG